MDVGEPVGLDVLVDGTVPTGVFINFEFEWSYYTHSNLLQSQCARHSGSLLETTIFYVDGLKLKG